MLPKSLAEIQRVTSDYPRRRSVDQHRSSYLQDFFGGKFALLLRRPSGGKYVVTIEFTGTASIGVRTFEMTF